MKIFMLMLLGAMLTLGAAPVSQQKASDIDPTLEATALRVLDDYMKAWNKQDLAGWENTFHFPHFRLASGKMNVLERAGQQDAARLWQAIDGWHHSEWDHLRIVHAAADKIHVDTKFSRYRVDGSRLGSYESLYILTKENGRWVSNYGPASPNKSGHKDSLH